MIDGGGCLDGLDEGIMDNCTIDCIQVVGNFSRDATCAFVEASCQQDTIQFIQGYYCLINQSFILLLLIAVPPLPSRRQSSP